MPTNCHDLRDVHSRLELAAQTFVSQIVKCQIFDASSVAQSVSSLPKRNIRDWKDAVRGLWCLFDILERKLAERHPSRLAIFGYRE